MRRLPADGETRAPGARRVRACVGLLREARRGMNEAARRAVEPLLRGSTRDGRRRAQGAGRARRAARAPQRGPARRAPRRRSASAARTSATKSQIVKSVSWPTPETIGSGDSNTARATTSSLNAHRSSSEPPPRQTISTSTSACALATPDRRGDLLRAPGALHGAGYRITGAQGSGRAQRGQHVAQGGRAAGRDDADAARIARQRTLAARIEQARGCPMPL